MPIQKERATSAYTKARCIERNRPYAFVVGQTRIQDLQPGHISPGKASTNQAPADHCPPEPVSQQRKASRPGRRSKAAPNENPLCINAVGQPNKKRRRQHITDKISTANPADLSIAQSP